MTTERLQRLFYGEGLGAGIHLADDGTTDDGVPIQALARTNPFSPAGEMGEALFTCMYLTVKHTEGFDLIVTPYIDDVALTESEYRLSEGFVLGQEDVVKVKTFEMPLVRAIRDPVDASVILGTVAPRGTRFSMLVKSYALISAFEPGRPSGELIFESPGIEYEVVREARSGYPVDLNKGLAVTG